MDDLGPLGRSLEKALLLSTGALPRNHRKPTSPACSRDCFAVAALLVGASLLPIGVAVARAF